MINYFDRHAYDGILAYDAFLNKKPFGDNKPIEELLVNLDSNELVRANNWYASLREPEQFNVRGVMTRLQDWQEYTNRRADSSHLGLVMVVIGSSLVTSEYNDIDLFLIPSTYEMGYELSDRFAVNQIANKLKVNNCVARFDEDTPYHVGEKLGNDELKYGKQLSCFLLHDKSDFELQRKPGDVIYRPNLSAKQLIELNRQNNTNFEVLYRKS